MGEVIWLPYPLRRSWPRLPTTGGGVAIRSWEGNAEVLARLRERQAPDEAEVQNA